MIAVEEGHFFTLAVNSEFQHMSPEVVNELISMMGQSVLRKPLCNIKRVTPHWFGIIADEATDVSNREQLNLSIRWVNDNYEVFEDPVGLFALPNTSANTITGSQPHKFSAPQEYYRQIYYQACDLLLQELADRFDQSEFLPEVLGLELFL